MTSPVRPPAEDGAPDDETLVAAVLGGDERAFAALVRRHGPALMRAARLRAGDCGLAEDIVQDTWLAALRALRGFEGRSALRTWLLAILGHEAARRVADAGRSIPFTAVGDGEDEGDATRFCGPDHPRWAGMWSTTVDCWADLPAERLEARETLDVVRAAIAGLPDGPRQVIVLRDVEGWTAAEACAALGLTEGNQRVLLHRARARVRRALEQHLAQGAR